jgi:hypothetical protein
MHRFEVAVEPLAVTTIMKSAPARAAEFSIVNSFAV